MCERPVREIGTETEPGSAAGEPEKAKLAAPIGPKFLPLSLPPPVSAPVVTDIRIELQRGAMTVTVTWPVSSASKCAAWMLVC